MNYWLYRAKAVVAFVGSVSAVALAVLDDGQVDANEAGALLTAVITAYGVYKVTNRPTP